MRRVALRDLVARRLRLALTALAIALGVTLIAGTYVFTDTIDGAFAQIFKTGLKNTDVAITTDNSLSGQGSPPPVPGSVLIRVRQVAGVKAAAGSVFSPGLTAHRPDGSALHGRGLNAVVSVAPPPFGSARFTEGHEPRTGDQIAILEATADSERLGLGDRLVISAAAPRRTYTISGIYTMAGVDSFGGGLIAAFTLPEAQRLSGLGDAFTEIDVQGQPGVGADELRGRVAAALRGYRGLEIRTGAQQLTASLNQIDDSFLGVLRTALLAFAGIALFVGAFLIFNTFSITVAQRTREFALLRVLGAKRRQILSSVLVEGLVLGVAGSLVGLGLGVLTAKLLRTLFKAVGADMPATSTVIESRTVLVSLLVGVLITMLSALAPALRATRVPPLAALREGVASEQRSSRRPVVIGAVLLVAGVAALVYGLFGGPSGGSALSWLGGGAGLTFLAVALLSPRLVGPIAAVVGAPLARRGIAGRLARQNAVRLPGRTAVTAAALMIGVALVVFASIFAAGAGRTVRDAVKGSFSGQAVILGGTGGGPSQPVPAGATPLVAAVPGVGVVAPLGFAVAGAGGDKLQVTGVDPAPFAALYKVGWAKGGGDEQTLARLGPGQVLVDKGYATSRHLKIGQTLELRTQLDRRLSLRVAGITDDKAGVLGKLTVTRALLARQFGVTDNAVLLVGIRGSAGDQAAVRAAIRERLDAAFPGMAVQSNDEFIKQQQAQVNQVLALIYALLAMAIVVSLFGIVNTLILSISERVHELGLLRAIGMSRRQVRRVIRYESVLTALIGATLGVVLGIVLAVLVTRAIDDFVLSIPVLTLVVVFLLSLLAGVVAAVIPARRAARVDVLEAIAYE